MTEKGEKADDETSLIYILLKNSREVDTFIFPSMYNCGKNIFIIFFYFLLFVLSIFLIFFVVFL